MATPAQLASPVLGGEPGRHAGPPGRRFGTGSALLSLILLAISCLVGLSRQYSCFRDGWGYPAAAHRLCASPVANALSGQTFPDMPGRARGGVESFTPGNSWFVDLISLGGTDVRTAMAFLLLINVAAVAVIGVALLVLQPRSSWVAAAFLSPVIMFSIGQGVEPVAVACALLAFILLARPGEQHSQGGLTRLLLAGVLFGIAAVISPIALLVPVAYSLWAVSSKNSGLRSDALVVVGITVIVLGVLVIADGRLLTRVQAWFADMVDRGSVASVLVGVGVGDAHLLGVLSLVLWAVATVVAAQLLAMSKTPVGPAWYLTVFFAIALLLLPAAPTTLALWLVPWAAATVHRLWVQIAWLLAEAAFFIAVNLRDAAATEDKVGLSEGWMVIFTLLRLAAVLCVLLAALWPHSTGEAAAGPAAQAPAARPRAGARASGGLAVPAGDKLTGEAAAGTAPAEPAAELGRTDPGGSTEGDHGLAGVIPPTFPDERLDTEEPRH